MSIGNYEVERGEWDTMKRSAAFVAMALAGLVVAAGALVGGAILKGDGGQGGQVLGQVSGKTGTTIVPGTLPFTGLDLTLFAAGAALLILAGWALRWTGRSES